MLGVLYEKKEVVKIGESLNPLRKQKSRPVMATCGSLLRQLFPLCSYKWSEVRSGLYSNLCHTWDWIYKKEERKPNVIMVLLYYYDDIILDFWYSVFLNLLRQWKFLFLKTGSVGIMNHQFNSLDRNSTILGENQREFEELENLMVRREEWIFSTLIPRMVTFI